MSKFETSYNECIITAEDIPHEETQLVRHADLVVEDAQCCKWDVMYLHKEDKVWEMII